MTLGAFSAAHGLAQEKLAVRKATRSCARPCLPDGGLDDSCWHWLQGRPNPTSSFSAQGYATGILGKWHLGSAEARLPNNRGFDEWYGIPRTYNEVLWPSLNDTRSIWPSVGSKQGWNTNVVPAQPIYEAFKGEKPQQVGVLACISHARGLREATSGVVRAKRVVAMV